VLSLPLRPDLPLDATAEVAGEIRRILG
jgi:hypothetical protein